MGYQIKISTRTRHKLNRLNSEINERIVSAIASLTENPRPVGCRKIEGVNNQWRIRVGEYRIIYSVDDLSKEVLINHIGHRRDVYRV